MSQARILVVATKSMRRDCNKWLSDKLMLSVRSDVLVGSVDLFCLLELFMLIERLRLR
jgi:hypothetical protein